MFKSDLLTYASSIEIPGAPSGQTADDTDAIVPVRTDFGVHHLLWMDCLQKVEDGKILRLMGMFPPGAGKSIFSSVIFPTHVMGRFPKSSIIMSSYGTELPIKFGRRARSIVKQPIFRNSFGTSLSEESAAADQWALLNGSEWMGAGILTGITGNRADGVVWDDLIKGREQAESPVVRQKTWDAYMDDLLTRKKPKAWEIGVTCMVGKTSVAMTDGSQRYLKDIRPGDRILSYSNRKVVSSKVLNWANKGPDNVFTIKTKSGSRVIANARHPFLIDVKGTVKWVRLRDMCVGDRVLKVTGVNGGVSSVRSVKNQPEHVGSVTFTMGRGDGRKELDPLQIIQNHAEMSVYDVATELTSTVMRSCSRLRKGFVQFVRSLQELMIPRLGVENFVLTTATTLERSEGYFATTVITSSENGPQRQFCLPPLNMYGIIPDEIIAIESAGREDVFDIQVEHTENFIADGLVSHNTRWHEDDPAGRILPLNYNSESGWIKCRDGNDWYVVCLPAECERADDPLGRMIGDIIWPEWFTPEFFAPFKRNWRTWTSLYQQRPSPETGDFFKAEYLRPYEVDLATGMPTYKDEATGKIVIKKREEFTIYGASDYAVTDADGDYTVHVVVGVDELQNLYLLDLWRKQASSDVWVEALCDLIYKWKPAGWAEEKGQIAAAMGPLIVKRMRERRLYTVRAGYPSRAIKEVRAQPLRGRMAMNGLYVPAGAPWLPALKSEMMTFPNGRHDDQVDALSLIGQSIDKLIPGVGPAKEDEPPKVFSTDPKLCTVTMDDMWEANDRNRNESKVIRIY